MVKIIKTYHARAVPALTCYALAVLTLAGPTPALYMGLGLVLLGTGFAMIKGGNV